MAKFHEKFEENSKDLFAAVKFDADMSQAADLARLSKAKSSGSFDKNLLPEMQIDFDGKKNRKNQEVAGGAAAKVKDNDDWIKSVSASADGRTRTVTFKDGNVATYTDGVLTERVRPGGGKDYYRWENGGLVAMERADGKTLKWQGNGYELFDKSGKSLGPSEFTVRTDKNESYQVQNRKVYAGELGDPSLKPVDATAVAPEASTITIDTAEPSKERTLKLLSAIESKDQEKANKLIAEFKSQNMSDEGIADAYQAYTGRSLKADMKGKFDSDFVDASPEALVENQNRYEKIFKQIDTDGNGILTDKETANAMRNENFKGDDAKMVAGYRNAFNESQGILVNSTMNTDDLKAFKNGRGAEVMLDNFSIVDSNKDGVLQKDEIIADASKRHFEDARNELSLLEAFKDKNGLSRNDLEIFAANRGNSISRAALSNFSSTPETSLYGNSDASNAIRPENFAQGQIGDCHLMSTLTSMSNTESGRKQIQNMIKDNNDGTYTVTFPGAPDEKFIVKKPTEAEQMLYAASKKEGTGYWANILENAYGQYANASITRRNILMIRPGEQQNESAGTGASPLFGGDADVVKLMTGRKAESDYMWLSTEAELEQILINARNNDTPIIVGRGPRPLASEDAAPGRHLYAVTGYDAESKTVTMRNPWNAQGKYKGEFKIPLSEFKQEFSSIAYNK